MWETWVMKMVMVMMTNTVIVMLMMMIVMMVMRVMVKMMVNQRNSIDTSKANDVGQRGKFEL